MFIHPFTRSSHCLLCLICAQANAPLPSSSRVRAASQSLREGDALLVGAVGADVKRSEQEHSGSKMAALQQGQARKRHRVGDGAAVATGSTGVY